MNQADAQKQFQRVLDAYPSYRDYLANDPSVRDPAATLAAWCGMLGACDSVDVLAAVDDIVSGETSPRDDYQAKDELARTIRKRAFDKQRKRLRSAIKIGRVSDLSGRFNCIDCRDSGLVSIWHPDVVAHVRKNGIDGPCTKNTCNAACKCIAGSHWRKGNDRVPALREFDTNIMCRYSSGKLCEIEEWLSRPVEAHPNFRQEFAEYSTPQVGFKQPPSPTINREI